MASLKKALLKFAPKLYFELRDIYQFSKRTLSGETANITKKSKAVTSFKDAYAFTNEFIKSHQIESEIHNLIDLINEHKPRTYVEIGTADAGTHYLIRTLCPSISTSVAIDTDIRNKYLLKRITKTENAFYITGFSNSPKTLNSLRSILGDDSAIDVLFIDGDHSYEGVKEDFELYRDFVRPGGLIIFHDIVEDWDQRYSIKTNKYTGGVPQFFSEIKSQFKHVEFIDDEEQDGFGIGVVFQT